MATVSTFIRIHNMNVYIYALSDPITNEIRYIGKSGNLQNRLKLHILNAKKKNTHIANWIKSIIKKGYLPEISIIEECHNDIWEEREIYWIAQFRKENYNLVNHANGGNQPPDPNKRKNLKKYSINKPYGTFRVRCHYNNTQYNLGTFKTKQEAIVAYDKFQENTIKVINSINLNSPKRCGVNMLDLNGNLLKSFNKIQDCADYLNTHCSNIVRCCRGKSLTHRGYKFKYREE